MDFVFPRLGNGYALGVACMGGSVVFTMIDKLIDRYILDEKGKPVQEPDLMKWGAWMQNSDKRIVARTELTTPKGTVRISTVFLALDHSFSGGIPVLWETMIFGSKLKSLQHYQERYLSVEQAKAGHEVAVNFAKTVLNIK